MTATLPTPAQGSALSPAHARDRDGGSRRFYAVTACLGLLVLLLAGLCVLSVVAVLRGAS